MNKNGEEKKKSYFGRKQIGIAVRCVEIEGVLDKSGKLPQRQFPGENMREHVNKLIKDDSIRDCRI